MNKILVTGGCGFLGSNLCKYLLNNNQNYVICLDNLLTGSYKNIEKFLGNKNFKFIKHDINIPIKLDIDQIYNFACPASPFHYQTNPIETIKSNFLGVMNMLDLAKFTDAKFLQASTSEIYGDPTEHPQKENYFGNVNTIGKRSCYDEGKRVAETLCFDYKRMYDTKIKIVRIFNTYGPNMQKDDGRVVSNFIVQSLMNKDITIYGNGNQTRSFCYVDDLIKVIFSMMNATQSLTGPLNIGNPTEYKIVDLAKEIIKLTNSRSKLIHLDLPEDDPRKRKPDISKALKLLNWQPKVKLEDGLIETIKYFEKILNE